MVIVALASAELCTAPAMLGSDSSRTYAVHTLLRRTDDVLSQFAELGSKAPTLHSRIVRRPEPTPPRGPGRCGRHGAWESLAWTATRRVLVLANRLANATASRRRKLLPHYRGFRTEIRR